MTLLHIISILLTLGSQPECEGFGICHTQLYEKSVAEECTQYENCIKASLAVDENQPLLVVSQKEIQDASFVRYFTKEHFVLAKDYTLPEELCTQLELKEGYTIIKGKYEILEEDGKILVRF
jgi:hypothetical protein